MKLDFTDCRTPQEAAFALGVLLEEARNAWRPVKVTIDPRRLAEVAETPDVTHPVQP